VNQIFSSMGEVRLWPCTKSIRLINHHLKCEW